MFTATKNGITLLGNNEGWNEVNVFVVDLEEELKERKHVEDIPSLFPKTFPYRNYKKSYDSGP